MWCPFCNHVDTRVVDSRLATDGFQIRRRRECENCGARFNTYETPALKAPNVIKADGTRELFDEEKLRRGIQKALEKRPVETQAVEHSLRALVRRIRTLEEPEVSSQQLGAWVAEELARLDQVAYVRFASVYRRFEDVQAFREEIERLEKNKPGALDTRQFSLLREMSDEAPTPNPNTKSKATPK
ncbi:MAG TPA: transcriptional regulator NrdR [Wenzhouxiangella sp.]